MSIIKRYIIAAFIFLSLTSFFISHLYAKGVGVSITGAGGIASNTIKPKTDTLVDYNTGFGFVYDNAVAKNKRMNYRLYLGYENMIDSGSNLFGRWSMHRITFSHTFGFKLWANKHFRLWMGPMVSLAHQFNKVEYERKKIFPPSGYFINSYSYKLNQLTLNFGGVLGININIGELFTIGFEMGMQGGFGVGPYEVKEKSFNSSNSPFGPSTSTSKDLEYFKGDTFCRLSFIFRINDIYISETPNIPGE